MDVPTPIDRYMQECVGALVDWRAGKPSDWPAVVSVASALHQRYEITFIFCIFFFFFFNDVVRIGILVYSIANVPFPLLRYAEFSPLALMSLCRVFLLAAKPQRVAGDLAPAGVDPATLSDADRYKEMKN
jgi:hypothetical protein